MIKGLEVLQEIKSKTFSWEKLKDSLDTIEKELKALEIIKEKRVNVRFLFQVKSLKDYNYIYEETNESNLCLTKEEFDLLREVLL